MPLFHLLFKLLAQLVSWALRSSDLCCGLCLNDGVEFINKVLNYQKHIMAKRSICTK